MSARNTGDAPPVASPSALPGVSDLAFSSGASPRCALVASSQRIMASLCGVSALVAFVGTFSWACTSIATTGISRSSSVQEGGVPYDC